MFSVEETERRDSSGKTEKSRFSMEQVKGNSGCRSKTSVLLLNMAVVVFYRERERDRQRFSLLSAVKKMNGGGGEGGGRSGKGKFGILFRLER